MIRDSCKRVVSGKEVARLALGSSERRKLQTLRKKFGELLDKAFSLKSVSHPEFLADAMKIGVSESDAQLVWDIYFTPGDEHELRTVKSSAQVAN